MAAGTAEDAAEAMGLAAVETPMATVTAARAGTATMETAPRLGAIPVRAMRTEVAQARATEAEGAATVTAGAKATLAEAAKATGPSEV
jgi:hypothetical protein